jgi:Flp pilus assembly protein protease CpaA
LVNIFDLTIVSVTSLSVFFDLTERRIPNWLILIGLVAALSLSGFRGITEFYLSILGFIVGITVFIVPFALGWMGAGDVKYFALVGALLGVGRLPRVLFYSVLAAGVIAVGYVALGRFRAGFFPEAWNDCKLAILSFGRVLPDSITARTAKGAASVPWGVAIGVGTIFAYYFDPSGSWAGF